MRVMLFTDTLGDVNGVSRFIRNAAEAAWSAGRDLRVVTSTRMDVPAHPNVVNVRPRAAARLPGYPDLEVVVPPARRLWALAREFRPDVVHVSTPGPVGLVGRWAAGRLGVPLVGVYHTDFPAYVARLFEDDGLARAAREYMRWFYGPFRVVLARSEASASSLGEVGIEGWRVERLVPGLRLDAFHPRFRESRKEERGLETRGAGGVRVVYVGRVSVEKNLGVLARAWPMAERELEARGVRAELVVVGDGPYRGTMERELSGARTRFVGFQHGEALSRAYASADLFVFPSRTDTLGQVVMEAQASGVPVVVSDRGGPREMVREGKTGEVVRGEEVGAWVGAIVGLAADRARREAMGRAAHEAMRGYSMEASFAQFWSVHERAREGME